mmetsp:Transcript_19491/g.77748  ORF Transcript_19491/g.77748 Transcript_19491/m.77748 type:complete len:102 (-) Transcript_19491:389-694(-)
MVNKLHLERVAETPSAVTLGRSHKPSVAITRAILFWSKLRGSEISASLFTPHRRMLLSPKVLVIDIAYIMNDNTEQQPRTIVSSKFQLENLTLSLFSGSTT